LLGKASWIGRTCESWKSCLDDTPRQRHSMHPWTTLAQLRAIPTSRSGWTPSAHQACPPFGCSRMPAKLPLLAAPRPSCSGRRCRGPWRSWGRCRLRPWMAMWSSVGTTRKRSASRCSSFALRGRWGIWWWTSRVRRVRRRCRSCGQACTAWHASISVGTREQPSCRLRDPLHGGWR
jgi:hypothetical protein